MTTKFKYQRKYIIPATSYLSWAQAGWAVSWLRDRTKSYKNAWLRLSRNSSVGAPPGGDDLPIYKGTFRQFCNQMKYMCGSRKTWSYRECPAWAASYGGLYENQYDTICKWVFQENVPLYIACRRLTAEVRALPPTIPYTATYNADMIKKWFISKLKKQEYSNLGHRLKILRKQKKDYKYKYKITYSKKED
jgi:hypothetical protein